jgi:hypothetical protein
MRKFILASIVICLPGTAFSSDGSWDSCTTADAVYVLADGKVVAPEKTGDVGYEIGERDRKWVLKTTEETCQLEGGTKRVTSMIEETTYEVYVLKFGTERHVKDFICQRGKMTLPEGKFCNARTVRFTEKYNKYLAKKWP